MKISVVVPTWQRSHLLRDRCLPSIVAEGDETEIIVVSDGPDDNARQVAEEFGCRFFEIERQEYPADPVARWHAIGLRAINAGLDAASGDWVLILADDDELAMGGLAALRRAARTSGADVLYGSAEVRQRDGSWRRVHEGPPLFRWFPMGSALIRRVTLGRTRLNPDAWREEKPGDTDFWHRLYAEGMAFAPVDALVYRYWPTTAYELPLEVA